MTQTRRPGSRLSSHDLITCKRCNTGNLAWAVGKSGKAYLSVASRANTDRMAFYFAPWNAHKCSTAPVQDDPRRYDAQRMLDKCDDMLAFLAARGETSGHAFDDVTSMRNDALSVLNS